MCFCTSSGLLLSGGPDRLPAVYIVLKHAKLAEHSRQQVGARYACEEVAQLLLQRPGPARSSLCNSKAK